MITYRVWCENGDLLAYGATEQEANDIVRALENACPCMSGVGCGVQTAHGYSIQPADEVEASYGLWGQFAGAAEYIRHIVKVV